MNQLFKLETKKIVTATILLALFFSFNHSNAQTIGVNSFIKGTSVEIGIDGTGGFEGTPVAPPLGFHPRGGAGGKFGFVANPQINAWATFDGDFFTPGSPENGWGLQVGTTEFNNNCNESTQDISGAITNYSHILDCYDVDWSGSVTSGTTVIGAKVNYFLQQFDLFYTTTIVLTNNSTSIIPLMYYYRNVDPDNNQSIGATFTTTNKIEDQAGGPSGCNLACVSATQPSGSGFTASYMAFAAVGADYRVCYGGFSNRSGSDIWNGVGFTQTVGSTNSADEAISLAYRIQNFLPGTSRTIKFVTILKASDKNVALANLLYLSYPGSGFFPPSNCSPVVDTVKACGGSTYLEITGPNTYDYSWSWSPGTFLSGTTSYSATCTPTSIVVYTITGTPTSTVCVSPLPLSYTIAVKPYPVMPVTISSNTNACIGTTMTFTAGGGTNYSWTGPNGFASTSQSSSITPTSTLSAGVYTAYVTNTVTGCTNSATVLITVNPSPTVSVSSATTICSGITLTLTAGGANVYSWLPSGSGTAIVVSPTTTTVYTATGSYTPSNCFSATSTTVTVIPNAIANYTGLINAQTFTVNNVLEITNTSTNYTSFNWVLCDGTISTATNIVIPLLKAEDCCIKLVATNATCKDSITKCYRVVPEFNIILPNVFTPNGDKVNDVFSFKNSGIQEMNCVIFDRWGLKMYEWNGVNGFWDGMAKSGFAPSGTYFYILNYTKVDGGRITEKNFFTLFRD